MNELGFEPQASCLAVVSPGLRRGGHLLCRGFSPLSLTMGASPLRLPFQGESRDSLVLPTEGTEAVYLENRR